ncbi:uncharacterized protein OCT59_028502 [Rhizophagus irregularis]|uniref:Tpk3p n=1 Tax=Rhizophagus irregularis (strain DAOM 197198w) TaxID=1432141 RepID=A0A015J0N3_RHIIW|nr:Tpk3p [Rhizophagus irregularis DAOM 197198w]UZO08244.1 hypothetical protein OCT59_028502 [Rhizophagus irregularis]GBC52962.1 kinase-like domain-containing protein [Rhizophagus irregularis DAOM 181602=DAOM 197198]
MSKNTKVEDLNYYVNWLERSIIEEHIELYKYSDFKNIQLIGSGAYGNVYRVNRKNSDHSLALKSFNYDKQTLKEVVKELKLHLSVNYHESIIRLYGITRVEVDAIQEYSFVLEYADSGTLNTYLNEHINELDWNNKYILASQLASAIEFLHENNIIHRDLHGNNVLIHKKNIKLADFGLSKKITEASSNTSKIFGMIPYIDPKKLDNPNYKLDKKSDVYSIGVLLWQISSGHKPFYETDYDVSLALSILNGKREKIIDGTPVKYNNLYRECWRDEPNKRPNMQEIVTILKSIISLVENDIIIDNINEKKEIYSMDDCDINSVLSKATVDLNNELVLVNDKLSIVSSDSINNIDLNNELILSNGEYNIIKYEYERNSLNQNYANSFLSVSSDVTESSVNLINFLDVNRLIAFVIKKHDRGITFYQVQQLIRKQILQTNQVTDQLIKWLLKNQDKSQYIWFLGFFYYYNIGVEENASRAFEMFSKAADDNCPIAQVYLAKCYYDGYGTNLNKNLSFYWYQKSAENGCIIGQLYLGNCYEFGIGTDVNAKKSFHFYKEATKNGNTTAILYLATCYRLGKGVEKNEIKAFKYYEIMANQEISDAQYQLGNCFYYGIGTKIDKIQAKCWYEKATNNGNIIAKQFYKKCYPLNCKNKINFKKSWPIRIFQCI